MSSVTLLVKHHLRMLFRSRATLVVSLVIPLLLLFLAGFAFDATNVQRVKVGVWASTSTDLTESIIAKLQQNSVTVHQYEDEASCIAAVKEGAQHACLAFVGTFVVGASNVMRLHVDPSRITLLSSVLDSVNANVGLRSSDVGNQLAKSLVDALQKIRDTVDLRKDSVVSLTTQVNGAGNTLVQLSDSIASPNATLDLTAAEDANLAGISYDQETAGLMNRTLVLTSSLFDQLEAVDAAINASTLSNTSKTALRSQVLNASQLVDDVVDEVNASRADLNTLNLTTRLNEVLAGLTATKASIDEVATLQGTIESSLTSVKARLDASLITIAEIQKAFNAIQLALDSVTITDPEAITSPVKTTIVPVTSDANYRNYAFPLLMVIVLLFTGLLIPPILMLTERSSPAALRALLAPISAMVPLQAYFLASLVVLAVQSALMTLVVTFFLGSWIGAPLALIALIVVSAVFILMGMIVGLLVRRELTAVLVSIIFGVILLFLSDFIIPLDVLPQGIAIIAKINPAVIGGAIVRTSMLFGSWGSNLLDVGALLVWVFVLAAGVIGASKHVKDLTLEAIVSRVLRR